MGDLRLVKPTLELINEYIDMINDWKSHNEKPKPWSLNLECDDFPKMIQRLEDFSKGIDLRENHVPNTTFWLVDDHKVIGGCNIRHLLNDYLLKYDGHIGAGIRPSERLKGYGTIMLSLALEKTKLMGINRVLITCNKGNIASERMIIKNGGIFESEILEDNGNIVRRFWIQLE